MTLLMLTCAEATALLTDFEDGALPSLQWLRLKAHLYRCPPCQAFFRSLLASRDLLRGAWPAGPTPAAEQALAGALARLREGTVPRGPQLHPTPSDQLALPPAGAPFLTLMLRVHLGHCAACRERHGDQQPIAPTPDPLDALRPHLPPEPQWRWIRRGLRGGRVAVLMEDPATGASLNLACLPGGQSSPEHDHLGFEGVLLLQGALQDGPAHLRAGDWISHHAGERHSPMADPGEACWALVAQERPVKFTGWRGAMAEMFG